MGRIKSSDIKLPEKRKQVPETLDAVLVIQEKHHVPES
jgi:hypothetical protein